MSNQRSYSELCELPTFEERFNYLKLNSKIGIETFGGNRYLNQRFYTSKEWKRFRREILIRDLGRDLGLLELGTNRDLTVHHINPITLKDVMDGNIEALFNPENAITTRNSTHKAIHYGDISLVVFKIDERKPFDMCPWR